MNSISDIFRLAREEKGLTIGEIIKATKIPRTFILALENNRFNELPGGLYPVLYVRKYAKFLGLSEEKMAAFFRRDYPNPVKKKVFSFSQNFFPFSPKLRKFIVPFLILFVFFTYLLFQYLSFVLPPKIKYEIKKTENNEVEIFGATSPAAVLKINGAIVNLDTKGKFSNKIDATDLKEITITVESPSGKTRTIKETVETF